MFGVCRERVVEQKKTEQAEKEQVSFVKGLAGLVKNKYWVLLVIALFAMYFMMSSFFGSAVYYAKYNMGDESYYASISNCLSVAQIATMFVTPFIMKKTGKRNVFLMGMLISMAGFLLDRVYHGSGRWYVCFPL